MQTTKPVTPRPPKPPSKSQEIMDKIKASIEADKQKPKKEVKPKVSTIQPAITPTGEAANDENQNGHADGGVLPTENCATDKGTFMTHILDCFRKFQNLLHNSFRKSLYGYHSKSLFLTKDKI